MAAVIRAAQLHAEPLLLATEPVSAGRASPPSLSSAPTLRPVPPRAEAPSPLVAPAELQRRLEAEHAKRLREATEQGSAQGVADGLKEGRDAGRAEWTERIGALDRLLASAAAGLDAGIGGSEDTLVEIAFEAVTRILGQAAPTREGVAGMVRQAMKSVRDRERVVIRLAPRDVEWLDPLRLELTQVADTQRIELVADERIESGGCLIETAGGGLDARLDTQLQRLRDVLLAARDGTGPGS